MRKQPIRYSVIVASLLFHGCVVGGVMVGGTGTSDTAPVPQEPTVVYCEKVGRVTRYCVNTPEYEIRRAVDEIERRHRGISG